MTNRLIFNNAMIVLLVLGLSLSCTAQKISKRVDVINYVLSDTLNPEFSLVPLKVRVKDSTGIFLGYDDVATLYKYCKDEYKWERDEFVEQMRSILLNDKIFDTVGSVSGIPGNYIRMSDCDCLYNEQPDTLKERVINGNYYKYPDSRFTCFVYKCFKKSVVLGFIEGQLIYQKLPK